jgi:hypothetical protein
MDMDEMTHEPSRYRNMMENGCNVDYTKVQSEEI